MSSFGPTYLSFYGLMYHAAEAFSSFRRFAYLPCGNWGNLTQCLSPACPLLDLIIDLPPLCRVFDPIGADGLMPSPGLVLANRCLTPLGVGLHCAPQFADKFARSPSSASFYQWTNKSHPSAGTLRQSLKLVGNYCI